MIAGLRNFLGRLDSGGPAGCFDRLRFLNLGLFSAAYDAKAEANDGQKTNCNAFHLEISCWDMEAVKPQLRLTIAVRRGRMHCAFIVPLE
jgi:hypothetical protein